MPCLPPLLLSGRRYVSRLFKDIDGVLSRSAVVYHPHPPFSHKEILALPAPEESKHPEPDSVSETVADSTDDLICQECREGLFAPESFQQAWTSSGLHHGFSYTATWTQVQVSAERGCEWCKLVLSMKVDGMEKQHILQVTAGVRQSGEFDDITPKGTQILRLTVNGTHHADYYVYADRDDPAAEHMVARDPILEVRSPLARSLAAECITDCIRNHKHCPAPQDAALPTRVVDCSDPMRPKLRLRNGERARYVALSYVAGLASLPSSPLATSFASSGASMYSDLGPFQARPYTPTFSQPLSRPQSPQPRPQSPPPRPQSPPPRAQSPQSRPQSPHMYSRPQSPTPSSSPSAQSMFPNYVPPYSTTTKNVHAYRAGIDAMRLPRTLRDAIMTTHLLGIQYLWVDALCVLQDSPEDRAREAARVRAIFRNAHVTIIAANAHGTGEGFLHDRTPPSGDVRLPFRHPLGSDGKVVGGAMYLSPVEKHYDGAAEPIHQRAWCLEERLLSPRALVYTSQTLQFHCQNGVTNIGSSVCAPPPPPPYTMDTLPLPTAYEAHWERLPDVLFLPDADLPLPPPMHRPLRHAWASALSAYTSRLLTNPADRLLACAALAEAFHRAWRTDYLAGLWRAHLPRGLLWRKDPTTRYPRPERARAPSWSWAAVDGRVVPLELTPEALALDPDLDDPAARRADDLGACDVVACTVALAAPAVPFGRVAVAPAPTAASAFSGSGNPSGALVLRAVARRATWAPAAEAPTGLFLRVSGPKQICVGHAYADAVEHEHEPEVGSDAADVWAVPVLWSARAQCAAGLVLAAVPGQPGRYRRVGFFHSPEGAPGGLAWMDGQARQEVTII